MNDALQFDAATLRRYDRPGPRYTSYPTAPQFVAGVQANPHFASLQGAAMRTRLRASCRCTCTSRTASARASIVDATELSRAIVQPGPHLRQAADARDRAGGRPVRARSQKSIQLHFGGGTRTSCGPPRWSELIECLRRDSTSRERQRGSIRSRWTRASSGRRHGCVTRAGIQPGEPRRAGFRPGRAARGEPDPERGRDPEREGRLAGAPGALGRLRPDLRPAEADSRRIRAHPRGR